MKYGVQIIILVAAFGQLTSAAEPETLMSIDQAFEQLASYDYGQDDEALHVLELHIGRFATDPARKAVTS